MNIKQYTGTITQVMAGDSGMYFQIDTLGGWACAQLMDPLYEARKDLLMTAWVNRASVTVWVDSDDVSTGTDAWPLVDETYATLP